MGVHSGISAAPLTKPGVSATPQNTF